jgi:hypothetical protein
VKIIFLDVDGVLNCQKSESRCQSCIGIDNDKVKRLRKIVEATGAKIVLCSSWKIFWEKVYKDDQRELANYLDRKLKRENLYIFDKTIDRGSNRGEGIFNWLNGKPIEKFIILDDDIFEDYEKYGYLDNLIKTEFYQDNGGIQDSTVENAIKKLNN